MPDESEIVLSCNSLSASYGTTKVLTNLTFSEKRGEWLGIIGPNGCGKTTLLNCLNKAIDFSGDIELFGRDLTQFTRRELAQNMAYVRQNIASSFSLTAFEVVSLGLMPAAGYLKEVSSEESDKVDELLESFEIIHLRDRSVDEMSGGERRMIFLAQAIIQKPKLLMLDEPTVHLDPGKQYRFLDEVERRRKDGINVISVFHDINLACRYVSELMILNQGEILAKGDPAATLTKENIKRVFGVNADIGIGLDNKTNVVLYPLQF